MPLTTADRVRQRLATVSGDTVNDTEITSLITKIKDRIKNLCGVVSFDSAAYDEYHSGLGSNTLRLKTNFITSITSVQIVEGDQARTLDASEYRIIAKDGKIVGPEFPCGRSNIRVIGQCGFTSIPENLKLAATQIVVDLFLNRYLNMSIQSQAANSTNQTRRTVDEIAKEYDYLLAPYIRYY
jgi:hypothetical protein